MHTASHVQVQPEIKPARAAFEPGGNINPHFTEGLRAVRQPPVQAEGAERRAAGSSRRRSRVKSVCRTFRFLLQQRRSVSLSAGLNEGLVSRATGCRSTGLGGCVYYQSTLVSPAGSIQRLPPPPPHPLSTHTNGHFYRRER